jgi:hypothetical protein
MFTGRVSLDHAREYWPDWVDAGPTRTDGGETAVARQIQIAGVLVVLFVFATIYSGVMIDRILAPIPGTQVTLWLLDSPETILEGPLGFLWSVGLNVVVLVVIAGLVALLYGISLRLGD